MDIHGKFPKRSTSRERTKKTNDRQNLDSLDTVRALHETVVALRSALETSQRKLEEFGVCDNPDPDLVRKTIERLALENHVLRERVLADNSTIISTAQKPAKEQEDTQSSTEYTSNNLSHKASTEINQGTEKPDMDSTPPAPQSNNNLQSIQKEDNSESAKQTDTTKIAQSESEATVTNTVDAATNTQPESNIEPNKQEMHSKADVDGPQESEEPQEEGHPQDGDQNVNSESDEDEEVDDIELIFTTDDTKEMPTLQETLESITEDGPWEKYNGVPVLLKYRAVNEFEPVAEEGEHCTTQRRNTLPGSREYRPIAHRDVLQNSRSQVLMPRGGSSFMSHSPKELGAARPILMERTTHPNLGNKPRESTGAQTDITALPQQWKSESYLARHKVVAQNFTTLPSKFAIPTLSRPMPTIGSSLRITDKNREARRALLSDLGFTSMVPELSRSVDHLCRRGDAVLARNFPRALSYMKALDSQDSSLASPAARNGRWLCECLAHTGSSYYPGMWDSSSSSMLQRPPWSPMTPQTPSDRDGTRKRYNWRASGGTHSAEAYRGAALVREGSTSAPWGSMPSSPTHQGTMYSGHWALGDDGLGRSNARSGASRGLGGLNTSCRSKSRVTFQDVSSVPWYARRSLPDLRYEHTAKSHHDSGGSTDSLIDEAEEYLRRSIDSIVTGTDWTRAGRKRQTRRHSEPDPVKEFQPPISARPFLPRQPRDLKEDCLVKIIANEGRVLMGRVRFVGTLMAAGINDPIVGVELPDTSFGTSDGTLHGHRLFDCEAGKAEFVPFKKVILAWSI